MAFNISIDNENVKLTATDTKTNKSYISEKGNPCVVNPSSFNLLFEANQGFLLSEIGFWNDSGEFEVLPLSPDKKYCLVNNKYFDWDTDFNIKTIVDSSPTPPQPPPMVNVKIDDENCVVNFSNTSKNIDIVKEGTIETGEYTITIKAKDGYKLISGDFYDSNGEHQKGIINADSKNITFPKSYLLESDVVFYVVSVKEQPPEPPDTNGVSGFNHIYLASNDTLKSLSKERFVVNNALYTDLASFILDVVSIPFNIPSNLLGLETSIVLGNNTIKTKTIELLDDEMKINLGSIDIPFKYNNSYDFLNTDVYLNTPFSDKIRLEPEMVIGQTIEIIYWIDFYNGNATITVISTKTNKPIIIQNVRVGRKIPFIKSDEKIVGSNDGLVYNSIKTPFIEVIRNKPFDIESQFDESVEISVNNLLNEKGYITINNIELNGNIPLEIHDLILTKIRNGVFIK